VGCIADTRRSTLDDHVVPTQFDPAGPVPTKGCPIDVNEARDDCPSNIEAHAAAWASLSCDQTCTKIDWMYAHDGCEPMRREAGTYRIRCVAR
jgi:hypothetical protein